MLSPSLPTSLKFEATMTAFLTPFRATCPRTGATCLAGMVSTTRSGVSGISSMVG